MNELEDLKEVRETVRPVRNVLILAAGSFLLLLSLLLAVSLGAADMPLKTVWQAIFQFDPDLQQHQIIAEIRFPRILEQQLSAAVLLYLGH